MMYQLGNHSLSPACLLISPCSSPDLGQALVDLSTDIMASDVLDDGAAELIQQRVDLADIASRPVTGEVHVADPTEGPTSCG